MAVVMRIIVNGDEHEIAAGTTVRDLLASLKIRNRAVAVERNLELVPASRHADCLLTEGDRVEIVTLVGGG